MIKVNNSITSDKSVYVLLCNVWERVCLLMCISLVSNKVPKLPFASFCFHYLTQVHFFFLFYLFLLLFFFLLPARGSGKNDSNRLCQPI